jgi:hypothetical protein
MWWLVVLMLALAAPRAQANGRNPHTVGIYFGSDSQTLYVATTFGLVISKDGGCTFHWVCEQNIGYGGTWDPHYAIAGDTIFATTFEGLRISRDGGCSFSTAVATDGLWIDALTIGPTGEIWIGTAETAGANDILRSIDGGASFQSRGMLSAQVWWKSVLVAPSNPARVYITGYQVADTPTGYFYRSDDAGAQWTPSPLDGIQYGNTPVLRVRAIDPVNPDIVFVSSEAANAQSGDRLYRSADGGTTWTEVLATTALVHDVVIRPGGKVLVATQLRTATSLQGGPSYMSTDGGASFVEQTDAPRLACLASAPDGALYGCAANWNPDEKAVARSHDDGATWDKVWRFVELADALQCPEGTAQHDTCDVALWDCPSCLTDLKRQFGATGPTCGAYTADGPPTKTGGCCGAGDPVGALWALAGVLVLRRARRAQRASSDSAA